MIFYLFPRFDNVKLCLIDESSLIDPDFDLVELKESLARVKEAHEEIEERINCSYALTAGHRRQGGHGGGNRGGIGFIERQSRKRGR